MRRGRDAVVLTPEGGTETGTITELVIAEVRKHERLLNMLSSPGKVIIHLNPGNPQNPATVELNFKL